MKTVDHLGSGDLTGCWLVQTASGSVHLLDFDSMQVTRLRAAEEPVADFDVSDLRRDGEDVPLLAIGPVTVGLPLAMVLQVRSDAVETTRLTTPVESIRRLPPGDTPPGATGRNGPTSSPVGRPTRQLAPAARSSDGRAGGHLARRRRLVGLPGRRQRGQNPKARHHYSD